MNILLCILSTANGCLDYLQFDTIINTSAKTIVVYVCEFLQLLETSVYTSECNGQVLGHAYLQLEQNNGRLFQK